MGEAAATAENLLDGIDAPLKLSRDELCALCAEPLARLRALLDGVLSTALVAESPLDAVEVLGGGCRMPIVQRVLAEALGTAPCAAALVEKPLGAKLDDSSMAIGAALLGAESAAPMEETTEMAAAAETAAETAAEAAVPPMPPPAAPLAAAAPLAGQLRQESLEELVLTEASLTKLDEGAAAKAASRNSFEGLVLEMRGLTGRKHGGKIDSAMLTPLLDAAEEWLYTDEGERASSDELRTKLDELQSATAPATARYYEAVAADKVAEESALETAAVQAAAERAAAGEDEDHDTRELELRDGRDRPLIGLPIAC